MRPETSPARALDPRRQQVVAELEHTILARYPAATFTLRAGIDEPDATYLTTIVDIEDPDEVLTLVLDRLLELQIEEQLPVYVLPVHPPARVAATMQQVQRERQESVFPLGARTV